MANSGKDKLPEPDGLRAYLQAIGKRGGTVAAGAGARVRFGKMTKAERHALAKKAAAARWRKTKTKKKR